jgi:hypothetical protein
MNEHSERRDTSQDTHTHETAIKCPSQGIVSRQWKLGRHRERYLSGMKEQEVVRKALIWGLMGRVYVYDEDDYRRALHGLV